MGNRRKSDGHRSLAYDVNIPLDNDEDAHLHVRLGLRTGSTPNFLQASLPEYCTMTRPIEVARVTSILGIDKALLKNDDIGEGQKIIGSSLNGSWKC